MRFFSTLMFASHIAEYYHTIKSGNVTLIAVF